MHNLINSIFKEAEFDNNERINFKGDFSANFSFFTRTHNNKFDFYLVANFKEGEIKLDSLKKQLDQCFESILEEMNETGIDKNLSFLLLLETESIDNSIERIRYIYNLEEDPYDFKKYVLTYTKSQVDALKTYIEENAQLPLITTLNNLLQEKTLFASFKKKEEDRSTTEKQEVLLYDLISKLFIKIPFLSVIIKQECLDSLKQEIDESLNQTQAEIVNLILEQHSNDPELHIDGILNKMGVEYNE
ncbi:ABC-three component system middle component 1 [Paucisalibacillus globulus]|uniref:ABC-three component system middle component 1 n=1 Tax=Paucisalibacillus globulus TaxID=351095 RepID=UPI000412C0EA|nr:ABC-three component system middle component 1 [Paucisalibacillus globulus]